MKYQRGPDAGRRVSHWWDGTKDVGRWFTDIVPTNLKGAIQWDALYPYGSDATWNDDAPSPLLTWERTILTDCGKPSRTVAELAGPPEVPVLGLIAPTPIEDPERC